MKSTLLAAALLFISGCGRAPSTLVDEQLAAEIRNIRAIDNHAHPVRFTAPGEEADRGFDALPVDNMEPQSDPVNLRPTSPEVVEAWRALWGYGFADMAPGHLRESQARKQTVSKQQADGYPAWVLDQAGIDIMLANRVTMGKSVEPPRFRWVPYADALLFPLDNSQLARQNSDRKAFFALEDQLRTRYLREAGLEKIPATLTEYLSRVVTPTLEKHKQGGALAEKFEAAYLRSLSFERVDDTAAAAIYRKFAAGKAPAAAEYKPLQDYLFRFVAAECGRLGMAVHIHANAGAGAFFEVAGANPLLLEPVLNDPGLRKTKFVLLHGGWPFVGEITAMLTKPNAYLDFSDVDLQHTPIELAAMLRQWLVFVPEKVLFGTDAYPYSPEMGWEESLWIAARNGRQALAIALSGMVRDGEITRARASELARMVLRENARSLYGL
jgi:uncharacterized protein